MGLAERDILNDKVMSPLNPKRGFTGYPCSGTGPFGTRAFGTGPFGTGPFGTGPFGTGPFGT